MNQWINYLIDDDNEEDEEEEVEETISGLSI
jgi:hypothetical protein